MPDLTASHVLCINESVEQKLAHALQVVKAGLNNNEDVLLLIENLSKDEILSYVKTKWKDLQHLADSGDITVMTSSEWYIADG